MEKTLPSGERGIVLDGDNIFLTGNGPSPTGDHPFLNRYNLTTKETKQLFKCDDDHYETVEGAAGCPWRQIPHAARKPHRAAQLLRPRRRRAT